MRLWEKVVATGLGTGYLPIAPATFASLLALLLWFLLIPQHLPLRCLLICIAFFYGVNVSARLSVVWGKDPRKIVLDEISGMWLVLLLVPNGLWPGIAGFLVFRAFDVVKPPPIRRAEAVGKGWGIMLHHVLAAGYTAGLIRLLFLISRQSH